MQLQSQQNLLKLFGNPITHTDTFEEKFCIKWLVPTDVRTAIPALPEYIFCNQILTKPLLAIFKKLIELNLHHEIRTYDGVYEPRFVRGSDTKISLHAFGLAIDLNESDNPLNGKSSWSDAFVQAWRDGGWNWGGDFVDRKDPMHFQWDAL